MKRRINILYFLVVLLVIFQIMTFMFVTIQFSRLDSKINLEVEEIDGEIEEVVKVINSNNDYYQKSFNDISIVLTTQAEKQENFEEEIDLLQSPADLSGVVEDSLKGVVSVFTDKSAGSGFFISDGGYIVTNNHVVADAARISILTFDKRLIAAVVIGKDELRDLALLKVDEESDFLKLADSEDIKPGSKVIAIGNPLGLSFTVTEGIVSAVDREGPNGIAEYIQTDVSLNPGNSGGPLIDTKGEVIGINNFKVGGAESLGFSLESNSVRKVVNSLGGKVIAT